MRGFEDEYCQSVHIGCIPSLGLVGSKEGLEGWTLGVGKLDVFVGITEDVV